jgi:hypothetical protein
VAQEKWHPNARAIWDHGIAKPGAEVVTDGHGHTVLRVRGKTFMYFGGPNDPGVGVKLSSGARTLLMLDPKGDQRYDSLLYGYPLKVNKYSGHHGWVDVWARDASSLAFVLSLIDESYGQMAPRRMGGAAVQGEASAVTKKTRAGTVGGTRSARAKKTSGSAAKKGSGQGRGGRGGGRA